jgi:hypothetical protein
MPSTISCHEWAAMYREVFLWKNHASAGTQSGVKILTMWMRAAVLRSAGVVSGPLGWRAMLISVLDWRLGWLVANDCHFTYPPHPLPPLSLPLGMEMRGIAPRVVLRIGKLGG